MPAAKKTINRELVEEIKRSFYNCRKYTLAKDSYTATPYDDYLSISLTVKDTLIDKWIKTQQTYYNEDVKRIYYLSMEFLIGRTLGNAMLNLGIYDECEQAIKELGLNIEDVREIEVDAGLGNGGLGRLAACFLDSMATMNYPAYGYGIRYEYGMFFQKIKEGFQVEEPDNWLRFGNPWEIERPEFELRVRFYGDVQSFVDKKGLTCYRWQNTQDVLALPYDMPVPGFDTNNVNTLRLWTAKSTNEFDFTDFNSGNYVQAVEDKDKSEVISKVLYPNDVTEFGKILRLKQQYFFVAASLWDIMRRFLKFHSEFTELPNKVAIQLNDTHPAIAIAEFMRLLVDEYHCDWKKAWETTVKVFGYTNHTLLPEALEKWPVSMMETLLPRHMQIIYRINYEFLNQVSMKYPGDIERLRKMSIIDESGERYVRMSHLAIIGSHSVNGVAALHSELLKSDLFRDFYEMFPNRFNNKTNGITPRRWLYKSNPDLSALISSKIGTGWIKDLSKVKKIEKFIDDDQFLNEWFKIKIANKEKLSDLIRMETDVSVSVTSMFDIQVKRIHEYKRQLLNVLHIIGIYIKQKEDKDPNFVPRTFIFSGKAAPGYYMAKLIIKLINSVGQIINNDPDINDMIKVVFLPNYRVSLAEKIFPAADLSEQISTAGKEASGTGNMKFAINGALTIGTLDGANVEIKEEVGDDNIFIFGLTVDDIKKLQSDGYRPYDYYNKSPILKRVIDLIACGFFSPGKPSLFQPIVDGLLGHDPYFIMADFDSYCEAQNRVSELYRDQREWTRKAVINLARTSKFSSDRTIKEYADEVWGAKPLAIPD